MRNKISVRLNQCRISKTCLNKNPEDHETVKSVMQRLAEDYCNNDVAIDGLAGHRDMLCERMQLAPSKAVRTKKDPFGGNGGFSFLVYGSGIAVGGLEVGVGRGCKMLYVYIYIYKYDFFLGDGSRIFWSWW